MYIEGRDKEVRCKFIRSDPGCFPSLGHGDSEKWVGMQDILECLAKVSFAQVVYPPPPEGSGGIISPSSHALYPCLNFV